MCHTSPLFYVSHQSTFKGNGDFNLPWVTKAWEDSIKWVSNCGLGGSLVKNLYLIFCLWANTLSILSPVTKILKHFQISIPHSLLCSLTASLCMLECSLWTVCDSWQELTWRSHTVGCPPFPVLASKYGKTITFQPSCGSRETWEQHNFSLET